MLINLNAQVLFVPLLKEVVFLENKFQCFVFVYDDDRTTKGLERIGWNGNENIMT